jgi:hypothetical protein
LVSPSSGLICRYWPELEKHRRAKEQSGWTFLDYRDPPPCHGAVTKLHFPHPPLMQIENVPVFNFYKIYNLVPTFPELRVLKRLFEPLCKKQQFLLIPPIEKSKFKDIFTLT